MARSAIIGIAALAKFVEPLQTGSNTSLRILYVPFERVFKVNEESWGNQACP